ncbi:MAG: Fibronectin type III domain protein [Candidatus Wolfebacteria bacterium GW2011_GWE1_48_7]|uniref:Fibronectin type III domain protein n=2 Tax=Candidatus Wolfeibacteriota TaxID=1752735 RepID=A0A0G1U6D5_9BACT|nr:MAG: fibronectin type III domain-containing protein [Candidatus Wolfebacteria bacterium GW2011_GWB1_47_1]KKU34425.1 MAG: Fibronectin type III domain protein [Candidatus Wolfebacteria bacterium GW2011_GWC2_46_275]KKU41897.1 MAG: Fibronectin type III domain protein [Candidatus Wolfebacteria bacterium GW2011_GWB2_46_69]KKU54176.1 MAG: Fibronectin type III domain protein [Candidatus Wolfebacteria bacterium GW2011_GWC1_47_103]KKU59098.1 MAG: Fibronectin type III domain protein [Candidatus Wolfeba
MPKQTLKAFLFLAMFFLLPNFSQAAIIFEDNFNDSPDWQSAESNPGDNVDWFSSSWIRNPSGPPEPPMQNWTSYRTEIPLGNSVKRYILSEEGKRGISGKGVTYNVESSGTWSGGGLDLYLGNTGYQEIFVRFYLRYDPATWVWALRETGLNGEKQKLIRISRLKDEPTAQTAWNPQLFDTAASGGHQMPVLYPDVKENNGAGYNTPSVNGLYGLYLEYTRRFDPEYGSESPSETRSFPMPSLGLKNFVPPTSGTDSSTDYYKTDGDWHSYEFRVKMNSAPGVADGEWETWVDGGENPAQHTLKIGVAWVSSGGSVSPGWNWFTVLDNVNTATGLPNGTIMKMYMDDFVVSDSFIGKDYIIGTADITAPAAPTGLEVI